MNTVTHVNLICCNDLSKITNDKHLYSSVFSCDTCNNRSTCNAATTETCKMCDWITHNWTSTLYYIAGGKYVDVFLFTGNESDRLKNARKLLMNAKRKFTDFERS